MTLIMSGIAGVSTILLLLLRRKKYGISVWLMLCILLVVGSVGYFGAALASYLSHGSWLGIRFYGKTVFATIALFIIAKIWRVDQGKVMDYYAPVDIAALIIMKINCLRAGCCSGIDLLLNTNGQSITFPSQILEFAVSVGIFLLILVFEKYSKEDGRRYAIYLLLYGVTRGIFEVFREEKANYIKAGLISISMCHIFCVVIICFGIAGIFSARKKIAEDMKINK